MKIYEYPLDITDLQVVQMPAGAKILSVASQNGTLCLWAMVVPHARLTDRRIEIIGTGYPIPEGTGIYRNFIGTVPIIPFVWHVFERV